MINRQVMLLADPLHAVNGVTVTARELAAHWQDDRWRLRVYGTGRGKAEFHDYGNATLKMDTAPVHMPLGVYDGLDFALPVLKTRAALRRNGRGIIQILSLGPLCMNGFWFAQRHDLPFITTHITRFDHYAELYSGAAGRWVTERIMRTLFVQSDMVIAHSPDSADEARRMGARRARYLPLGIPMPYDNTETLIAERRRAAKDVRRAFGLDTDAPLLLYVGRFALEKDIASVLAAARELGVPFVFAGDGPLKDEVAGDPRVIYAGTLRGQALDDLYLAADLLVSASVSETVGRVFLEALAHGTPILVADKGQHNSFLTESGGPVLKFAHAGAGNNAARIVAATREYLSQRAGEAHALAGEALARAQDFAWEAVLPDYVACYEEVLANYSPNSDRSVASRISDAFW